MHVAPLQDSCFYLHPPEARAQPMAPQPPPTAAERAAKAAAWRAHNAAHMRGSSTEEKATLAAQPLRSASPNSVLVRSLQLADDVEATSAPVCGSGASLPEDPLFEAPDWGDLTAAVGSRASRGVGMVPKRKMGARQRNKIRNRFRSGVFRRCGQSSCFHELRGIFLRCLCHVLPSFWVKCEYSLSHLHAHL